MSSLSPSVAAELIGLLYRHVPAVLAANLANSGLMVAALWPNADRPLLAGWAAAVVGLTLTRGVLGLSYRRRSATGVRWGRRYTVGAALSGTLWGSSALLFIHPGDPTALILVSFVIGGMGAGAVTSLSAHMPAFYLYLLCSMVPFEVRLLSLGDRVSLAMSGMALVYIIGLLIIGRHFNSALVRALVLNEENQRLLATREQEVQQRTAALQATNAELEWEIAERKKTEDKLEEARAEAEQANQAKSRFLAAASHDLRQPLQSMFLFASTLHRFVVGKKGVEALVRIERGLDTLKGMLDSLLDLSRLDVNVVEPRIASVPLRPMLDEILDAYRRIAISKGIALRHGAMVEVQVRSDQILLGRMVRNLVENAIRYTERGTIVLSSRRVGDRVCIEVEDTGIGIAPDQLERIFEEFHQVGNPERDKARGLGLGLAIIQRLSAILDHPVEVRSQLGVGSTFAILVPLAAAVLPSTAAAASPAAAEVPAAIAKRLQVVVIDDDPMVLLALSAILEQWGYGVVMAGSQDEAIEQLRARAPPDRSAPVLPAPDLIVADYRLRNGRTGIDAIRAIRAGCGVEVPSIVLTGETGTECVTDAEAIGAIILHKPVTPHELTFGLRRLMGADAAN